MSNSDISFLPKVDREFHREFHTRTYRYLILRESEVSITSKLTFILTFFTAVEIAKRIPGRNESSVKNRWYNVKTSEKKAKKKAEQALRESLEAELAEAGGDQKPAAKQEE